MQVANSQLKRSQKTDFNPSPMTRERSFVKPTRDNAKRRSQTMATIKNGGKPSLEIYRPPNVRSDLPAGKLNVHAKEFTMVHDLQGSRSSGNLSMHLAHYELPGMPLQQSKSSGNVLRNNLIPILPLPLIHSSSSSQVLLPRPPFQYHQPHPIFSGQNQPPGHFTAPKTPTPSALKRSKSLGASDSAQNLPKLKPLTTEDMDLTIFTKQEDQNTLKQAIEDPNQLSSRLLMNLVKTIMEKAVEGIRYSEPIAKLCITIISREKTHTFLESLLNTCQQWYQQKDRILRGVKAGDGTRFTAFMWFLTEMSSQIKRHQLKEQFDGLQPDLVLLSVLAMCCQACVSLPITCLTETECLFFVLTSIGRDLEAVLPEQLEQLLGSVRDGFLATAGAPAVRRTLLQLIELHASNWQLPGSSVLYYYPRSK